MSQQLVNFYNKIKKQYMGPLVTRFPPEPSGYLHLGHVKAIYVNFELAKMSNGICYLRFDDTNPATEKQEYIDNIIEDVKFLGYEPDAITFTSDYFDQLLNFAITLIKNDLAYVCNLTKEEIREQRDKCIESINRNNDRDTNLELFNKMVAGTIPEGTMTLRLKCDMQSKNANMRDPVIYRIITNVDHPRSGSKYKVYPTYDYSHCIVDYLENITHSLCSIEFKDKNELYVWILVKLFGNKYTDTYLPKQIEYAKVNIEGTILSKRKISALINTGLIDNWTNCALPTIKGLKNKGYTKDIILEFTSSLGLNIGKVSMTNTNFNILEEYARKALLKISTKITAIKNPLPVTIINTGETVWVDGSDFKEIDTPDFYRLTPNVNKYVRIKNIGIVTYNHHTGTIIDNNINIFVNLHESGNNDNNNNDNNNNNNNDNNNNNNNKIKCKATIGSLKADNMTCIDVLNYGPLYTGTNFNTEYLTIQKFYVSDYNKFIEPITTGHFQFERSCYIYKNGSSFVKIVDLKS